MTLSFSCFVMAFMHSGAHNNRGAYIKCSLNIMLSLKLLQILELSRGAMATSSVSDSLFPLYQLGNSSGSGR